MTERQGEGDEEEEEEKTEKERETFFIHMFTPKWPERAGTVPSWHMGGRDQLPEPFTCALAEGLI